MHCEQLILFRRRHQRCCHRCRDWPGLTVVISHFTHLLSPCANCIEIIATLSSFIVPGLVDHLSLFLSLSSFHSFFPPCHSSFLSFRSPPFLAVFQSYFAAIAYIPLRVNAPNFDLFSLFFFHLFYIVCSYMPLFWKFYFVKPLTVS